jgi:hypothetical protein
MKANGGGGAGSSGGGNGSSIKHGVSSSSSSVAALVDKKRGSNMIHSQPSASMASMSETNSSGSAATSQHMSPDSETPKEQKNRSEFTPTQSSINSFIRPRADSLELYVMAEEASKAFPPVHCAFLAICWLMTFTSSTVRRFVINRPCSSADMAVLVATFSVLSAMTAIAALRLSRLYALRNRLRYMRYERDVTWSLPTIRLFVGFFMLAGVVSSWVGIGPAAMMTPFLVIQGRMDPRVVQAVSAVANALMSSSVALQIALAGGLLPDYAIFLGCLAFWGAVLGLALTQFVIAREPSLRSIIVLVLSAVFGLSFVLEVYIARGQWDDAAQLDATFSMNSVC